VNAGGAGFTGIVARQRRIGTPGERDDVPTTVAICVPLDAATVHQHGQVRNLSSVHAAGLRSQVS
jgi:hypothetical protein